jgi:hypothetical protein
MTTQAGYASNGTRSGETNMDGTGSAVEPGATWV